MRGCDVSQGKPSSHAAARAGVAKIWSQQFKVTVAPQELSPRCGDYWCTRAEHWKRKRRKKNDRPNDIEHRQMMMLVANGTSQAVVAHIFGITQQAVSRAWQAFVPNYHGHKTGGDRKGRKFERRSKAERARATAKIKKQA